MVCAGSQRCADVGFLKSRITRRPAVIVKPTKLIEFSGETIDFRRGNEHKPDVQVTSTKASISRRVKPAPRCLCHDTNTPPAYIGVYDVGSAVNARRALAERLCFVPVPESGGFKPAPAPEPGAYGVDGFFAPAFDAFAQVPTRKIWPLTYSEFIRTSPDHKRELYRKAVESLRKNPLTAKDSAISTFLKLEKADYSAKEGVPRLVNPRDPRFNVEWGRYIRPIEHLLYDRINEAFGYRIIAKGQNAMERGQMAKECWQSFVKPLAIPGDARRFDQHVHYDALRWETRMYSTYIAPQVRTHFYTLARQIWTNRGTMRTPTEVFRWQSRGIRSTGDMNTSSGNIVLMCSYLFMITMKMKERGLLVKFLDDGDDFVAIMETSSEPVFKEIADFVFNKSGHEVDFEPSVSVLEQIVFCQCSPIFTTLGWKMVRNWRTALPKDMCTINRSAQEAYSVLKSIGVGGLAAFGDIPILSEHYRRLSAITGKSAKMQRSGFSSLILGTKSGDSITDETRMSFYRAFNVRPDQQKAIEALIRESASIVRAEYPDNITLLRKEDFEYYSVPLLTCLDR